MSEPLITKEDVLETVEQAFKESISNRLSDYDSPLNEMVDDIVKEYHEDIKNVMRKCLSQALESRRFEKTLQEEFDRFIANTVIERIGIGVEVEMASAVLQSDPVIKNRVIEFMQKWAETRG